jgi:hypothetical protein
VITAGAPLLMAAPPAMAKFLENRPPTDANIKATMLTSKCSPLDTAGLVGAGRRRANRRRPPGDSWEVASWSICQRLLSDLLAVAEHAARLDVVTGGLLHGRSLYPRGAGPTLGGSAVAEQP